LPITDHRSPGRAALAIVALLVTSGLTGGCGIARPDEGCSTRGTAPAGYAAADGFVEATIDAFDGPTGAPSGRRMRTGEYDT
jgi:hypothetical protein